jgi:hypothetical protein
LGYYFLIILLAFFSACGGVFTSPTGMIRSPYFPEPYPSNRECEYFINQPAGTRVTLTFNTFDIEGGPSEGNCAYDYLEVRLQNNNKLGANFFKILMALGRSFIYLPV